MLTRSQKIFGFILLISVGTLLATVAKLGFGIATQLSNTLLVISAIITICLIVILNTCYDDN